MKTRMKVVRNRETGSKIIRNRRRGKKKTKIRMEFYREYVWKKWRCRRGKGRGT